MDLLFLLSLNDLVKIWKGIFLSDIIIIFPLSSSLRLSHALCSIARRAQVFCSIRKALSDIKLLVSLSGLFVFEFLWLLFSLDFYLFSLSGLFVFEFLRLLYSLDFYLFSLSGLCFWISMVTFLSGFWFVSLCFFSFLNFYGYFSLCLFHTLFYKTGRIMGVGSVQRCVCYLSKTVLFRSSWNLLTKLKAKISHPSFITRQNRPRHFWIMALELSKVDQISDVHSIMKSNRLDPYKLVYNIVIY